MIRQLIGRFGLQLIQILKHGFRYLIILLVTLYTVGFLLWRALLHTSAYDRFWQLQVSEIFGSWLYLPLLPLVFAVLLVRRPKVLLILCIPFLFFFNEYGRQFLPSGHLFGQEVGQGIPVRVMSWNMLYTRDKSGEFQAEVAAVAPDIVVLQELNYGMHKWLPEMLGHTHPHQQIIGTGNSASLAILSRYPFIERDEEGIASRDCVCLKTIIDIEGTPVTVVNIHPWSPDIYYTPYYQRFGIRKFSMEKQNFVFDTLLDRLETNDRPLLVMGDLNTTERQPNYWRTRRALNLEDSFAAAGWGMGYTYPNEGEFRGVPVFPFIRIDHILHSDAWVAQSAWTGKIQASDHRYVVADLRLMGNEEGD